MEALVLLALGQSVIITEVCANPLNEATGEFVELHNPGSEPVSTLGFSITDGDALDSLHPWSNSAHGVFPHSGVVLETDTIPPGGWALIFELGYLLDPCYSIAPGTVILTTGDNAICNGLAASSDPLTLFGPGGTTSADVISTYGTPVDTDIWQDRDDDGLDGIPFDPGDGMSVFRFPLLSPDAQGNWHPGEVTPGAPPDSPPDTFSIHIQNVWWTPENPEPGGLCLLFAAVHCWGTTSPSQGDVSLFIDINGDSLPGSGEPQGLWPASMLQPGVTDTLSLLFTAPVKGWYLASAAAPEAYMGVPLPTGGGVNPVITEVMANPWSQSTQEFIEVYYPGPGVFQLSGCRFTDGDAVDLIIPWSGTALIPGGACGVIMDPDYTGGLPIPEDALLFTVTNAALGNGLATNDPIVLYDHNGTMIVNMLSTAGTPVISDDPLQCDDDGLDGIPFNPGQGNSMERMNPLGPDAEFNWTASEPGGSPGWLVSYDPYPDVRADTIIAPGVVNPQAPFQVTGVFSSVGGAAAYDVSFYLFNDLNADGFPDNEEIVSLSWAEALEPGEIFILEGSLVLPDHGFFLVRALAACSLDTLPANDMKSLTVQCGPGAFPVITEVLCNPSDQARDEFVEVFYPGPGVFDPSIITITDGDATDILSGDYIPSGRYALILDPDYFSGSMPYSIPPGTPIILPGNSTIGDGLSGNDPVSLLHGSTVVSTYGTPEDPGDGIPFNPGTDRSVERLSPHLPDLEENWFVNPLGPSPGAAPVGLQQGVDYGVVRVTLSPPAGDDGTPVTVQAVIGGFGTESGSFSVVFTANGTPVGSVTPVPPSLGDSTTASVAWAGCGPATAVSAEILCHEDLNPHNNKGIAVWSPASGLLINEIMYSPESPGPEWVELYNGTENGVFLGDFTFSDPSISANLPELPLEKGGFAILCPDLQSFTAIWGDVGCPVLQLTPWPTLNNQGDTLSLTDGATLDWVPYKSSWGGGRNTSLERRSGDERGWLASNWGSCASGGTPGTANSIGAQGDGPFLSAEPRIFSPDGDGSNDLLQITLRVPGQGFHAEVRVYDVTGRLVTELWNAPIPGETLALTWDGGQMPVGRYLIFARATRGSALMEEVLVRILAKPL